MSEDRHAVLPLGPDWLLSGFDVSADRFNFAKVNRQSYLDSVFLDHRIQPRPVETRSLSGRQVDEVLAQSRLVQAAWIFHTGFCGSTLLATCLDHPGNTLVLREPLVLSRLAQTKRNRAGENSTSLKLLIDRVVGLCERSYAGERLLVKPSNFANALLPDLFPSANGEPNRKALLMTSGLESLLLSILKKRSEAEATLTGFLRALLQDSDYLARVGISDISSLHLLQQSVLFWHCQRHFLQQQLAVAGHFRFKRLSMERLLAEPEAVLMEASAFLGLGLSGEVIRQTVSSGAFRRHSKQAQTDYGPDAHLREQQATRALYGAEVTAALNWAEPLLRRVPVDALDALEKQAGLEQGDFRPA